MIKTTKVLKEDVLYEKFCDVCGKKIHIGMACSKAQCQNCKKDLCNDCIGHEENCPGDYREVYCKKCWEIGYSYRTRIDALEAEIDTLYQEWLTKCNI